MITRFLLIVAGCLLAAGCRAQTPVPGPQQPYAADSALAGGIDSLIMAHRSSALRIPGLKDINLMHFRVYKNDSLLGDTRTAGRQIEGLLLHPMLSGRGRR